jgi:hypothetical protein
MLIPGVPDSDLKRLHWIHGRGRGALGLCHVPSGVTVVRECLPDTRPCQVMQELEAELSESLQSAGLIAGTDRTGNRSV